MRIKHTYLSGSALPTVVVVSVVMLTMLLGLLMLWEHEELLFARMRRLRQARADIESAYTIYGLHPENEELTPANGYLLYDSLPLSRIYVKPQPWGLYEAVSVTTADSLICTCRLFGAVPEPGKTLFYADNRSALTLTGHTELRGTLQLPQNGLIYGRIGSDFFSGAQVARIAIKQSESALPAPTAATKKRIHHILTDTAHTFAQLADSVYHSFKNDSTLFLRLGNVEIGNCTLRGKIIVYADELRIDASCRIEHALIHARKITVGNDIRIRAQLFATDTVLIEPGAVLEYPSGIYAQQYVDIREKASVDGYVIVCDTVVRKKPSANYRQDRTACVRGLLYVDGVAQVQGIVSGRTILRQATYFSPQGYYKDMLYDAALLENAVTAQPLWLKAAQRKEVVCVD